MAGIVTYFATSLSSASNRTASLNHNTTSRGLVITFGAGGLIHSAKYALSLNKQLHMTAIELDPTIVTLAKEYPQVNTINFIDNNNFKNSRDNKIINTYNQNHDSDHNDNIFHVITVVVLLMSVITTIQ